MQIKVHYYEYLGGGGGGGDGGGGGSGGGGGGGGGGGVDASLDGRVDYYMVEYLAVPQTVICIY